VSTPYPLHLDLRGKRALVVGAGPVGVRRARALAASGAAVAVVAIDAPDDLALPVELRAFEIADVEGHWLVMACTGVVDDLVAEACAARGIWCVRADDAALSAAWVPAVARVDDIVVSVTAGRDPRRAKEIRDALELTVSTGQVSLRRSRPGVGSVAFVGGGPGDPGLLTVRAAQLLAVADVVVRDALAPAAPLSDGVEVVDASGMGNVGAWLVERAHQGQRVVRLTAGEGCADDADIAAGVAACVEEGVAVEVVPGVAAT
jgi:uroporphyrin-III C-methyltransferase/precorrin-2 dehydrogenase/sirohydrochlorin ferrochelatase